MHVLIDIGHSFREGFFMFWETLWALVLGFGLSGAVQAFVSRAEMERLLGRSGPREIARASLLGAASSSCSYAASAMAKTLFQRGADFVSSMAFMFASTNLVIELGIVLWVLIGWEFALAELVGGVIMIALFSLAARFVLRRSEIDAARAGLGEADVRAAGGERPRPTSLAGWADAASYTLADAKMLRKEMAAGYVVAGFLAVLVPASVWHGVFISGHGFWTSLENVVVGPFIAIVSFVCSVGNVPLAAALWHGGISFGGVVSFVFADLITLPLLLIYRRYYGGRLTLKLLAIFWTVMSAAGLAVEYLFRAASIQPTKRPAVVAPTGFRWNYTTYLDIVFLVVFAALWWLARNQRRLGGGVGYAIDPVCGMQVDTANAAAHAVVDGETFWFCSDHCRHRFETSCGVDRTQAEALALDVRAEKQ
ncbi:MAG TPA: permease [Gaiellaceae bacterium]|nr:permease [Gaiellaceae bacterium]